jgi:hypothetical protein
MSAAKPLNSLTELRKVFQGSISSRNEALAEIYLAGFLQRIK